MTSERKIVTKGPYQADSQTRNYWYSEPSQLIHIFMCFCGRLLYSGFVCRCRICTQLCRNSTSRESTLRRRWRVVCCMEGISTLLSTGSASTLKMVKEHQQLFTMSPWGHKTVNTVTLLICLFTRGAARRVYPADAGGEPEEQAQVPASHPAETSSPKPQSTQ